MFLSRPSRGARLEPLGLLGLLLPLFLLAAAPSAWAGRNEYVHPEHGFSIRLVDDDWKQTPLQPGERIEVAKFREDTNRRDFATLSIQRFTASKDAVTTPGIELPEGFELPDGVELPPGMTETPDPKARLERELKRTYRFWGVEWKGLPEPDEIEVHDDEVEGELYVVKLQHPERPSYYHNTVAAIVERDGVTYMLVYTYPHKLKSSVQRDLERSIESFMFSTGDEIEAEDIEERGEVRADDDEKLLDPAKRAKIKAELANVQEWKFIDTPHYIVIYNCDQKLARFIADRIEYMRQEAFEKVFPPVAPIEACMVVRVCREMDEYYHYGAPRGSAGYWSSYHDELVFPDLSSGSKPDDTTIGVLHHEGFHQYINYALHGNDPPVWFNEGYAEYFFCVESTRPGRKLKFEKRHPMRYGTVKTALGTDELIPIDEFIRLSHRQYMQRADLCYAQGWAFATWLKNVTKNDRYREIPDLFFRELQKGYGEREGGGGYPQGFPGGRDEVVERALKKAFEGIDLAELDEAFREDLKRRM